MPRFDHAFDWARRNVDDGPLPTAVLGVATAEGIAALDAFGGASVDDHYPLFSATKPIVGLAAMWLIEQEGSRPSRRCPTRCRSRRRARRRVRSRHLVSYTAGITEPPLDTPGRPPPAVVRPRKGLRGGHRVPVLDDRIRGRCGADRAR